MPVAKADPSQGHCESLTIRSGTNLMTREAAFVPTGVQAVPNPDPIVISPANVPVRGRPRKRKEEFNV